MTTLPEFIKTHSDRVLIEKLPFIDTPQDDSEITLSGILVSASEENYIVFSHLGQSFHITWNDVINIEESEAIPNSFEKGIAVKIKVKTRTHLIPFESLTAIDLDSNKPYAIVRPSQISEINNSSFTAKELAWLADTGIANDVKDIDPLAVTISIPCYLNGRQVDDRLANA